MGIGRLLLAGLAAAAGLGAPAAGASDEASATHRMMASAGFIPLGEMTFAGRDVRRVITIDPYGGLAIPGLELERHADGRRTLRAQYRGWTGPAWSVTEAEWDRLAQLEPAAFAPPGKSSFEPRPNVVVHCWRGAIAASPARTASWWGCDEATRAAQEYADAVLALAIRKRGCPEGEKDLKWRFSHCFLPDTATLDDPALQERLAALRAQWSAQWEDGSDILMKARLALRAAKEERTPARIAAAREAVFAFGRQQEALRAVVQSSFDGLPESGEAGGRNGVVMAATRRQWFEDIEGQNRNYIGLLEDLARLLPAASGA